jgi:septum formation protein
MTNVNTTPLILASTSTYRSELLARLRLPYKTSAPHVDETPIPGESAKQTSWRLSRTKAQAVAQLYPEALIIGSDQVALLGERQLGKPLTHDNAVIQLRDLCGQTVTFYTALTLLNSANGNIQTEVAVNHVHYRALTDAQIESYLQTEKPYHCAGSTKSEGLGIALIKRMEGDDPNALIGLPLMLLIEMLLKEGVEIL